MRGSEYQSWFCRAFQSVEGALGVELSTPLRNVITEDYVRASFMRGFALSYPAGANRVQRESPVVWSNVECIGGHAIGGQGRPLQHDIGLSPEVGDTNDAGAILELKWLTGTGTETVAQDIWKLALSRSVMAEGRAVRTYLALGGSMAAVSNTLSGLRNLGLTLRWSPAGRGGDWPAPSGLDLDQAIRTRIGSRALHSLLRRGTHVRTPPRCRARLRASLRSRWFRSIDELRESEGAAWRFLLWELDCWGASKSELDWEVLLPTQRIACRGGADQQ